MNRDSAAASVERIEELLYLLFYLIDLVREEADLRWQQTVLAAGSGPLDYLTPQ
jgi:hypothetical protein